MNTETKIRTSNCHAWKLFTFFLALFCVLIQNLLADDTGSFKIEEAQRATREHYEMVFGIDNVTWTWPARHSDNATPPTYPPDGFYDSDLTNATWAANLVQDLANKLGDPEFLEQFVTATDGDISKSALQQQTHLIPVFSTTATIASDPDNLVVGKILAPVSATTDNYPTVFSTLTSYICQLKYVWEQASQQSVDLRALTILVQPDCAGVQNQVINALQQSPWGSTDGSPIGKGMTVVTCHEGSSPYSANWWGASGTQQRGKIECDLSNFNSGSGQVYLKLGSPDGSDEAMGQTRPTDTPPDEYGLWANGSVQVGSDWVSDYVTESDTTLTPLQCPSAASDPWANCVDICEVSEGWNLENQVVIIAPDYQYPISDCNTCDGCSQCSVCSLQAGNPCPNLGSVDYRISLGLGAFGKTAGRLLVKADRPNALLSTPQLLRYQAASFDQVITTNGTLRQLLAPSALVNVLPIDSSQYEIDFYTIANAGTISGGIYHPTGSPFVTYTIANPDAFSTGGHNRLIITENSQGVPTITEYDWSDVSQQWQMITGNGASQKSHSYVWNVNQSQRTDSIIISNSTGQVISKQIQTYQVFSWGTELVQEQVDPDGANLTTTWSYYDSVPATNINYGHLQQTIGPTGHWTTYQYDQFGRTTKTVEQFLDSTLGSPDNSNRVTTTTYSDSVPQETIVETVLGQEISRRYRVNHPNEVDDIQCQTAGAAWNATGNLINITKTVPGGVFEGDTQSIVNLDGTMSLYQYTTNSNSATITVYTGQPNSGGTAIVDGTETVTVKDYAGNQISSLSYDIVSGLILSSNVTTQTDDFGRPTTVVSLGGTNSTVYGCCGLMSSTDAQGITTSYTYDSLKRTVTTTRAGITTSNSYDAAGRVLTTSRIGADGSVITLNTSTYDVAGRQTSSIDGMGYTTSYSETIDTSGHAIKTTTYPDGSTRVETHYQDGQLLSVTGTAVHGARYVYGVDSNGQYTQAIKLNAGTDTSEWTKTYNDLAGRSYKTVYADGSSTQSSYNNQGQLARQVDPDGVTTLVSYNAKGELVATAIDMNQNGSIDDTGTDRITSNAASVVQAHGGVTVRRTSTYVYIESGSVLVSTADTSSSGLNSWTISNGLTNQMQTVYAGSGNRVITTTNPDGSYTISQYQNDRLISATQYGSDNNQILATTYSYDSQGRVATQSDARTGPTTFTFDNDNRQTSMSVGGQTTTYFYDSLGRQTRIVLPDNGVVNNAYLATGELTTNSGARICPVAYSYDYAGRNKTMQTWQAFAANSGTATTSWNYDALRGLLISKTYADSSTVTYSNSPAGRLLKRTWARGIVTTYTYDHAGGLTNITYSDATPGVTFTFDRRGRRTQVVDGAGTHALTYNDAGQWLTESFPSSGVVVTNVYDSLLRRSSLTFVGASISYSYDNASRLNSVNDGIHSASYSYLPNSPMVSNIVLKTSGVTKMTMEKSYDNLNRLTSVRNSTGGSPFTSYTYTYNSANERTKSTLADSSFWLYTYDALGQVTGGQKYWSDGTSITGEQFGYAFDTVGNRQLAAIGGDVGTYTVNILNEYTQRIVPGYEWELGQAASNATVTINDLPVTRKGQYFAGKLSAVNSSSAVYTQLVTLGLIRSGGTNLMNSTTGHVFVARSPELFGYDADGNLTNDGRWSYSWDAENRLVQMQTLTNMPLSVLSEKLQFAYEYQSRRISKVVSNFNGSTWSAVTNLKFIYDGWNLLAEIGASDVPARSYMWGVDVSGSSQGSGGVGGLLAVNAGTNGTNFVAYDGNGNVSALVDASSGSVSAQFEYGSFGEVLRVTGAAANLNPFRFSTKYADMETGLLYYGYRYYTWSTGRWLSRDPIEEEGGANLYVFVKNVPTYLIDPLGHDVSFCDEAVQMKNVILFESAVWNSTSPAWSEDNQCSEQAGNLVYYLESLRLKSFIGCCGGKNKAQAGFTFRPVGGSKVGFWPFTKWTTHFATLVESTDDLKKCCNVHSLVLDPYKGNAKLGEAPNLAGIVQVLSLADWWGSWPYPVGGYEAPQPPD